MVGTSKFESIECLWLTQTFRSTQQKISKYVCGHANQMPQMQNQNNRSVVDSPNKCTFATLFDRIGCRTWLFQHFWTPRNLFNGRSARTMDSRWNRTIRMDERQIKVHEMQYKCWLIRFCDGPKMRLSPFQSASGAFS